MTAEEQFLIDNFPEEESGFGIDSLHKVHRRVFTDILRKYASQQRTEGIKEGFQAARDGKIEKIPMLLDQYGGVNIEEHFVNKYPTADDYLNSNNK